MNSEFEEILAGLQAKPARSRLEPYGELIAELRCRGRSFREIAAILVEKCHVNVAASTVVRFVASQSRRKNSDQSPQSPKSTDDRATAISKGTPTKVLVKQSDEDVRRRIEERKRRPIPAEPPRKLFHYDPDKPLTLIPKTENR